MPPPSGRLPSDQQLTNKRRWIRGPAAAAGKRRRLTWWGRRAESVHKPKDFDNVDDDSAQYSSSSATSTYAPVLFRLSQARALFFLLESRSSDYYFSLRVYFALKKPYLDILWRSYKYYTSSWPIRHQRLVPRSIEMLPIDTSRPIENILPTGPLFLLRTTR